MEILFDKCLRDLLMKRGKTQSELAILLTNQTETQCELLINFMNSSDFDSVRDKDWFQSTLQELKSVE